MEEKVVDEKEVEEQFKKKIEAFDEEIKKRVDLIQTKPTDSMLDGISFEVPVTIEVDNKEFLRIVRKSPLVDHFVLKIPVKYCNSDELCAMMYVTKFSFNIFIFTKIMKQEVKKSSAKR